MPPGLVALLRIPGLGPKKIKVLHDELKIESLGGPARGGRVGKDRQDEGVWRKDRGQYPCGNRFRREGGRADSAEHGACGWWRRSCEQLRAHPDVIRIEVCGSLRRRAETIGDLDILFSSDKVPAVLDAFVKLPQVATVLGPRADQGQRAAGRWRAVRFAGS